MVMVYALRRHTRPSFALSADGHRPAPRSTSRPRSRSSRAGTLRSSSTACCSRSSQAVPPALDEEPDNGHLPRRAAMSRSRPLRSPDVPKQFGPPRAEHGRRERASPPPGGYGKVTGACHHHTAKPTRTTLPMRMMPPQNSWGVSGFRRAMKPGTYLTRSLQSAGLGVCPSWAGVSTLDPQCAKGLPFSSLS